MNTTIFLAQIWGPVLVLIGLGVFFSKDYYIRIYRDLEKEKFATLIFGMMAVAAGITHILAHNIWDGLLPTIITLLGWGLLLKGAVFTVFPKFADQKADWAVDSKLLPASATLMIILGVYLSWVGYLA
jgi:hypothetical protein